MIYFLFVNMENVFIRLVIVKENIKIYLYWLFVFVFFKIKDWVVIIKE